jgi:hypothetical protein
MKFKKRGLGLFGITVILIISLMLSGCQTGGKEAPKIEGPYAGGKEGLLFAFNENEPPARVLDNSQEEFYVTLLVRNKGEHTVPVGGAIASISGVDSKAFGLNSLNAKNQIEISKVIKDQDYLIEGGEEFIEFETFSYVNDLAADFPILLRADLCYTYNTEAIANVCLKKNVVRDSIEDVCQTNNDAMDAFNSGAPLQVTNIRQRSVGSNKLQITFTVENIGMGLVYLPGTFTNACKGGDSNEDTIKVTLSNPQNNFSPDCAALGRGSSGDVRLVNKKKDITCTIDTSGLQEVTFQDLLVIDLDYMYREAVKTDIVVENAV